MPPADSGRPAQSINFSVTLSIINAPEFLPFGHLFITFGNISIDIDFYIVVALTLTRWDRTYASYFTIFAKQLLSRREPPIVRSRT